MKAKTALLVAVLLVLVLEDAVFRRPKLYEMKLSAVEVFTAGAGLRQALTRDAYAGVQLIKRNRLLDYALSKKLYSRRHFVTWVRIPEASYPIRRVKSSINVIGRSEHFVETRCKIVDREDRMAYARCPA